MSFPLGSIFSGSTLNLAFGGIFVALVLLACVSDVRHRRIPNALVATLALTGIAYSLVRLPVLDGAATALGGIGAGLVIWIGFYALGVLGAGDVKFFSAAAAWLGPSGAWRAALIAAAAGGVLAVLFLLRDSRLGSTMRRLVLLPVSRSFEVTAIGEMSQAEAKRQLPYGLALAVGVVVVAVFPAVLR